MTGNILEGALTGMYGPGSKDPREIERLRETYGPGRWRKRKGIATIRLANGALRLAELHWYEATGIGRREFKIKQLL